MSATVDLALAAWLLAAAVASSLLGLKGQDKGVSRLICRHQPTSASMGTES